MTSDSGSDLAQAIEEIQRRWGSRSIGRLGEHLPTTTYLSTGISDLDHFLQGGWPRGRINELIGRPTSGLMTMALNALAQAQQGGGHPLFLDVTRTVDPGYARHLGVSLEQLTLIRPHSRRQALSLLQEAVQAHCFPLIVLDLPDSHLNDPQTADTLIDTLDRLLPILARSETVLLVLVSLLNQQPLSSDPLAHHAAVRMKIERQEWQYYHGDIAGYQSTVTLLKNKLVPKHDHTTLTLTISQPTKGSTT